MYALHSTLLPSSAIHHALFLANFTPSTIYQLPKPHAAIDGPDVKVVGNLVVAGGQDLRVFEIREEARPVQDGANGVNGDDDVPMSEQPPLDDMGDSFFDSAPTDVSRYAFGVWAAVLFSDVAFYREHPCDTRRQDDCTC